MQRDSAEKQKSKILKLDEIETSGAVIPQGWNVFIEHGVQKILRNNTSDELAPVCSYPLIITKISKLPMMAMLLLE